MDGKEIRESLVLGLLHDWRTAETCLCFPCMITFKTFFIFLFFLKMWMHLLASKDMHKVVEKIRHNLFATVIMCIMTAVRVLLCCYFGVPNEQYLGLSSWSF